MDSFADIPCTRSHGNSRTVGGLAETLPDPYVLYTLTCWDALCLQGGSEIHPLTRQKRSLHLLKPCPCKGCSYWEVLLVALFGVFWTKNGLDRLNLYLLLRDFSDRNRSPRYFNKRRIIQDSAVVIAVTMRKIPPACLPGNSPNNFHTETSSAKNTSPGSSASIRFAWRSNRSIKGAFWSICFSMWVSLSFTRKSSLTAEGGTDLWGVGSCIVEAWPE